MRRAPYGLGIALLTTLTACSDCGEAKPSGAEPAVSGARAFNVSWDGGRRHLRLRGRDLGNGGSLEAGAPTPLDSASLANDGGSLPPSTAPAP